MIIKFELVNKIVRIIKTPTTNKLLKACEERRREIKNKTLTSFWDLKGP